MYVVYLFIPGL